MEDRYEKGMKVLEEINKNNIENLFEDLEDIAPDLGRFVVEFPYSEIYTRKTVDLKTRELCTIAALTSLGYAQNELSDHIHAALKVGNTPEEIIEIIIQMSAYAGFPAAINAAKTAKKVFKELNLLPLKKE